MQLQSKARARVTKFQCMGLRVKGSVASVSLGTSFLPSGCRVFRRRFKLQKRVAGVNGNPRDRAKDYLAGEDGNDSENRKESSRPCSQPRIISICRQPCTPPFPKGAPGRKLRASRSVNNKEERARGAVTRCRINERDNSQFPQPFRRSAT